MCGDLSTVWSCDGSHRLWRSISAVTQHWRRPMLYGRPILCLSESLYVSKLVVEESLVHKMETLSILTFQQRRLLRWIFHLIYRIRSVRSRSISGVVLLIISLYLILQQRSDPSDRTFGSWRAFRCVVSLSHRERTMTSWTLFRDSLHRLLG